MDDGASKQAIESNKRWALQIASKAMVAGQNQDSLSLRIQINLLLTLDLIFLPPRLLKNRDCLSG